MKSSAQKLCCNCNATLPWRYKGRQKIYCNDTCRNIYNEQKKDILRSIRKMTDKEYRKQVTHILECDSCPKCEKWMK